MPDNAVTVERHTQAYGPRRAVDELSFVVPSGKVTGLDGPNGAGKSTTFRMLLGLVRPSAGEATVLGISLTYRGYLKNVGALVESPAFHPALTGIANLRAHAQLGGLPGERIPAVLARVGLAERGHEKVNRYWLGMKQRSGVAAALLPDPAVPLLDEPVNGPDLAGIRDIRSLFRTFADEGRTVLVSSHLLADLEEVCDHLVVVYRGRLVHEGSVDDLLTGRAAMVRAVPSPRRISPGQRGRPGSCSPSWRRCASRLRTSSWRSLQGKVSCDRRGPEHVDHAASALRPARSRGREPRARHRFLLGRVLGLGAFALGLMAAIEVVALGMTTALIHANGLHVDRAWSFGGSLVAFLEVAGAALVSVVLGVVVGSLVRAPGPAVGVVLAYLLSIETIVTGLWSTGKQYLPGQLLDALILGATQLGSVTLTRAIPGSLLWGVGLLLLALAVLRQRDVLA